MFKKLFEPGFKEYKRCVKLAKKIDALAEDTKKLSNSDLQNKTIEFKERYNKGETLDDLLVEAFAVAREACTRISNKTPFFVQLIGGASIHGGNIAEMKTGEGKTLTSVMPAYLNALSGKSVHIVTVNEYLANREANGEIGDIFRFLGLTVGLNLRDYNIQEKKEQYLSDILYSTNAELGFDYLRDHMAVRQEYMVQRGLHYAIIDEVDSILIDEARTPLIISGGEKNNGNLYANADRFAKRLKEEDYLVDIESKTISLSESGMSKAERAFSIANLYDLSNVSLVHHINNALRANFIMARDVEYVVEDNEILIVDQFTGRILKGRQYSDGLHQALEAKESVAIKKETVTVATITYQNYFRMYEKLSGMTGTAKTEEEEFMNIYNMYVVEIPTNVPVIRTDLPDLIFVDVESKYKAIANEVEERYKKGQPVLLGTISIETSEILSKLLNERKVPHNVLNAKQHDQEALIVDNAGQKGSVTIATNMAGRGTDIKLGEGVKELGGLAVVGSERHESRRIDNQLRGRSGRQGDPGTSRFYLSTDDELLQRFGGDALKKRLSWIIKMKSDDKSTDAPLESKFFSGRVKSAQKRIEGYNYDARKNVLKYDDVLRKQREVIYEQRTKILTQESISDIVKEMTERAVTAVINRHIDFHGRSVTIEDEKIVADFNGNIFPQHALKLDVLQNLNEKEIFTFINDFAAKEIEKKEKSLPADLFNEFLKVVVLRSVDTFWTKHIDVMSALRQSVGLQSIGQTNPFQLYMEEGFRLFAEMNNNIALEATRYVIRAQIRDNQEREEVVKPVATSDGKEDSSLKKAPVKSDAKAGPNDLCPCGSTHPDGSQKKYKHCCMRK
ncbi:MAG: preprotein translocase subunit SecA [Erysipelotrichales bacterium]|nr:preprotein translocase subunit SecA [Erysipelotrichales bacterium]